jgi:Domain of unknown function (DUF4838)
MVKGMPVRILYSARAGKVLNFAARELAHALHAMMGERIVPQPSREIAARRIQIEMGRAARIPPPSLSGDNFATGRFGDAITLDGGSERAVLHAVYEMLERLGARYPAGKPAEFPRIDPALLRGIEPHKVEPAFSRRAFGSDIMTWQYGYTDRLEQHLAHDREFIPWMARRGINAFLYIRHAHDTQLRIDELVPLYRERGIASEYGGHVIQLLLPRERFDKNPEFFPAGSDGTRMNKGNLCVSNADALKLVCDKAMAYVRDYPENEMLHIWPADVQGGAWCRCGECAKLSPQLQYMKVVSAVAERLGKEKSSLPVAYLAYHDTIEPDARLRPLANVHFEWAPRERCYSHAIDDPKCEINPRYFDSLKCYIELFSGRGHVFEYYQDSILFGGLGFATPSIIARDMRAYRALGIGSISSLTFGAFSVLAYPVNVLAYARGTRDPNFNPDKVLADVAAERHPECSSEMASAYRLIEQASAKVVDYADVMLPQMAVAKAKRKRGELAEAAKLVRDASEAAEQILSKSDSSSVRAERELWNYGAEVLDALAHYLEAKELGGADGKAMGEKAIEEINRAAAHIQAIDLAEKGTWAAYDFEWIRGLWLDELRRRLSEGESPREAT